MSRAREIADRDLAATELILDADNDTSITADTDDQIDIRVAGSDQIKIATSEVAFNEASGDIDFRVEGNGDANALFVEGESDNVGIGNNDPLVKLDVTGSNAVPASSGTSQTGALRLGQGAGNGVLDMGFDTTNSQGWIQATNKANLGTNYTLNLNPNGGDVKIGAGDIFFGGSGKGINLGVTSNTDGNTLDDYEEGVFTLSFNGFVNQTVSQGYYVKVGRLCYVTTFFHANGSQNTNSFTCDLPFTAASHSASNNSGYYVGSIGPVMHYRVDTGSAGMVTYVAAGTAQFRLYEVNADGDWVFMQNNAFSSEDQAWISFTYVTAS